MEMRMREDTEIGSDLTPPLPPLASSLHDSNLASYCSACFSPLPLPTPLYNTHNNNNPTPTFLFYCSSLCSASDSPLHFACAEHHLFLILIRHSHLSTHSSADLRAALRLLHILHLPTLHPPTLRRICGLLTNRHHFINSESDDTLTRILDGGKAMAIARCMRDGREFSGDSKLEEALLCLVLTNAVEMQVNGGPALGIAVYDWRFSWINHSCSPNACYRFSLSSLETRQVSAESSLQIRQVSAESSLQIIPAGNDEIEIENAILSNSESIEGFNKYGPRIIVRSTKAIRKGEEVWVAYIDLLQPKDIRHAELWVKYRFSCCCRRCNASPLPYVDLVLQEMLAVDLYCTDDNICRDKEMRELTDYIDDVVANYLSVGDPEACCGKLESALAEGLPDALFEAIEGKSRAKFRLHPLHHLSLAAYTALSSSYRVRASQLMDLHSETDGDVELEALSLSKASAAYSLLLAGATHHLFLIESSLIASTANFWMGAGESLLNLARSSLWNSFAKGRLPVLNLSSVQSHICCDCSLADELKANFFRSRDHKNEGVESISKQFLYCVSSIIPKVWSFLMQGHHLCRVFEDANYVGKAWNFLAHPGCSAIDFSSNNGGYEAERINLCKLGIHCILYGGFLSSICYGSSSHLNHYIRNLIYGEENLSSNLESFDPIINRVKREGDF